MRQLVLTPDLRADSVDWHSMAGWKRFALMGLMVALPVPVFAASGLAVPLPSIVYRAAIGVAERTQAVAVALPGLEVVAETTQAARRGAIKLSPEERATRSTGPEARPASGEAHRVGAVRSRQFARQAGRLGAATRTAKHRPKLPRPAPAKRHGPVPVVANLSSPEPDSEPHPRRPGPEPRNEKKQPAAPEEGSERAHPSPGHTEEPKHAAPKEEPKGGPTPPPSPPPAVPPPLASPPPLPVTTPSDPVQPPAPLTPKAQLEEIAADLQEIVETRTVDRVAQALEKVESAVQRLEKNPPDKQGAVGDIKNAVQKLDDALAEGEISLAERTLFVTRLKSVSTLLAS